MNSSLCTFAVTQRSRKKYVLLHLPQFLSPSPLFFSGSRMRLCVTVMISPSFCAFLFFLSLALVPFYELSGENK